jgi:hypothetical protein
MALVKLAPYVFDTSSNFTFANVSVTGNILVTGYINFPDLSTQANASPASSGTTITGLTYYAGSSAATAGGQALTLTGSNFDSGSTVYVGNSSCSTTYVSPSSLTFTSPAKAAGPYHLYVYTASGTVGFKPSGITYASG